MSTRKRKHDDAGSTAAAQPPRAAPTDDEIARRAYDLFLSRGGEHGRDVEDWLQAERELKGSTLSEAA